MEYASMRGGVQAARRRDAEPAVGDPSAWALAGQPATSPLDRHYQHLTPDDRAVFRRLSVLGTEFDAEAAVVVCHDSRLGAMDVVGSLNMLEFRGLIQRVCGDSEKSRFRWPESTVEYGAVRLAEHGEAAAANARLADWIWEHARRLTHAYMLSREQNQWFADRVDYLVRTVEWTWSRRDDDRHDLMAVLLANIWLHNGRQEDGRRLIDRALRRSPPSPYRSDLLLWGLWFTYQDDQSDEYLAVVLDAVAAARAAGTDSVLVRALTSLACVYVRLEDDASARRCFEESIALARQLNDDFSLSACSHIYAWFLLGVGEAAEACAAVSVTLPSFEEQAGPFQYASYRFVAGASDLAVGALDAAEEHMRTAVGIFNSSGPSCFYPIGGLALIALLHGRPSRCLMLLTAHERFRNGPGESTRVPQWWERKLADARLVATARLTAEEAEEIRRAAEACTDQQLISYALGGADGLPAREPSELTRREHEIAMLIAQGLSNRRIAGHLQIAESTVASHTKRIYAKLGIHSRTQLAAWMAAQSPCGIPRHAIATPARETVVAAGARLFSAGAVLGM
ncbi:LuxR C-terminal-related transcriptional regulator [Streptomyces sp. NPDC048106]|uniref:LuxR C-terminal-related transcriptional regulator n=1 Tax=Streptomyces sp. NPDC048106 TaxID=3155750 RepID=UPI0034527FA3